MPSKNSKNDRSMMGHWGETVADNPMKSAAAAAGAVAAGVFLWSKRNEISNQISRLSDQVSEWADEMRSSSTGRQLMKTAGMNESDAIEASRSTGSRSRSTRSTRSTGKSSRSTSGRSNTAGTSMNSGQSATETMTH
jgi:hypothetical protein